jgi:predicted PurR-regulated permease PerM
MTYTRPQLAFYLFFLLIVASLVFFVFRPYFGAVVIAATFAVMFYPIHRHVLSWCGNRKNIAAFLTTLFVLLVVIIPCIFFGSRIFFEARYLYTWLTDSQLDPGSLVPAALEDQVRRILPEAQIDVRAYVEQGLQWFLENVGSIFSSFAKLLLNIFISLLTLFYLFRDGERLREKVIAFSPLKDTHDELIVQRLQTAINSVIKGSLLIGIIQGVVTGTGLAIFGVPNPVLWGGIAALAALVPNIGTAVVLTPAIVYLFVQGHTGASIGLLVWGVVAVGFIDDFLGPRLINREMKLHPVVILLAVLGGLSFFGPLGYILGPLVVSLLVALLDLYPVLIRTNR